MAGTHLLRDSHGRTLRDLRVSVTDRCDFRCLYCLPDSKAAENFWAGRAEILTFEEIERVARLGIDLGITKVRLTGGEPLLRRQIEKLVERLARLPGLLDLAMTTNGLGFRQQGKALRAAGLQRVSFSLDSLDRAKFKRITGQDKLEEVLDSIVLAQELGFKPVKVNAVIIRGLNDDEIEALAEFGQRHNLAMRFIEFMPLDSARGWRPELVVPGRAILRRLQARYALQPASPANPSETAQRWRFAGGTGEIGLITSVSEPFCAQCSRLRLTADGKLRTCLFSPVEHDLRGPLRGGASDDELRNFLREAAWQKEPGHRIGQAGFTMPPRGMSCIGG